MSETVVVFARRPVAGRVKTRLVPPLTPALAAEAYEACLRDTLALAGRSGRSIGIAYDGSASAAEYFAANFPDLPARPQPAGDLGARMAAEFDARLGATDERVAIIGSDSPTLPPARIADAFRALDRADVALGPSEDGGYFLVAIAEHAWPRARALFTSVPWSTAGVLEATLAIAQASGLRTELVGRWYDVDTWPDLRRAAAEAADGSHLDRLARREGWGG